MRVRDHHDGEGDDDHNPTDADANGDDDDVVPSTTPSASATASSSATAAAASATASASASAAAADSAIASASPAASSSNVTSVRRRRLGQKSIFASHDDAESDVSGGGDNRIAAPAHGRRHGRKARPHHAGSDAFFTISVHISGWAFANASNRLVLDAKVNDNTPVGRPPMHLPPTVPTAGARNVPLENYAMSYGANGDGTVTYGLLRLYTSAWVDEEAVEPVYIARHGRILQIVLPHHAHNVSWGALFQSATIIDNSTIGAPAGSDDDASGDSNSTDVSLPPADVPVSTAGDGSNTGPLPGDGSVPTGTQTGGETDTIPLPPATGDVPEPEAASGASAAGVASGTLIAVAAGAAFSVLQMAARA